MGKRKSPLRSWCAVGSACVVLAAGLPGAQAGTNPLVGDAKPARARLAVKVAPGNWGTARASDVQSLLEAVAAEFQRFAAAPEGEFSEFSEFGKFAIRVVPRNGSPRVLYERGPEGEYLVHLSARNENWFQYAYQFSHELCHIFSRFDHKERNGHEVATANQWFEEALCETASLFTLRRLGSRWSAEPPDRLWANNPALFTNYADFLQAQAHRRLPAAQSLDRWYRENEAALRASPYLREKNELVASALLPLFERNPELWRALAYLNPTQASAAKDFRDFLGDWYAACPAGDSELTGLVGQTMALFGFAPPAVALQRLSQFSAQEGGRDKD
ncbi:MAG: hypothetical protein HYU78_17575 [Rhodocyclales bacterium]|nr:hypothetical protein [Rhodocyclales bacterium]